MSKMLAFPCLLAALGFAISSSAAPEPENGGMPLLVSEDFDDGLDRWEMTDPTAWETMDEDGNKVIALTKASDYEPPVRSPHNIARIKDLDVTDFIADFQAKQTGREYGHRDLCFFFGYQDAAHFYYVHLATTADEHANSIFLVNGEPRVSIAAERTDGTVWGEGYHHVRIKRDVDSGRIEVYFDDMDTPVMKATDKAFISGTIGIGSFDDVGQFDQIAIWGKASEGGEQKQEESEKRR